MACPMPSPPKPPEPPNADCAEGAAPPTDAGADVPCADALDVAALRDLRRSVDAAFAALEARFEEARRREREAKELEGVARQCQDAVEQEQARLRAALDAEWAQLHTERRAFEEERLRMAEPATRRSDVLTLNVGGERILQRRRSTLCAAQDSFLAARFSGRWEQDLDRDDEGRYFINYSPELFLPLLDYLSLKETEDPAKEVQLPIGPDNQRPQFQAMLKYFGMLPAVSILDAMHVPYDEVTACDYGLAFELLPKTCSLLLTAVETCAGKSVFTSASVVLYTTQGTLLRRLRQRDEWKQIGQGVLHPGRRSRIEFAEPVLLQARSTHCMYLATSDAAGIAFGGEARGNDACAENDDLQVHSGRTSGSAAHFSGFEGFMYWFRFNGRFEYTMAVGV